MEIKDFCESYFAGFQEAYNFKRNQAKVNALAALKIVSYFTVIIPLGFGLIYGISSLCGRVSEKQNYTSQDLRVDSCRSKAIEIKQPVKNASEIPQDLRVDSSRNEATEIKQLVQNTSEIPQDLHVNSCRNEATEIKQPVKNASEIPQYIDIRGKTWLSAIHINLCTELFSKTYLNLFSNLTGTVVFKKTTDRRLIDDVIIADGHFSNNECSHYEKNCQGKTLFAYPVHVSGNHWTLVFIDREQRTLEYYDSMKNYGEFAEIQTHLKNLANKLSILDSGEKPYKFICKINKSLQTDSYQCGIWVIYFIEERLKNPSVDFNSLTDTDRMIAAYREKVQERLLIMHHESIAKREEWLASRRLLNC